MCLGRTQQLALEHFKADFAAIMYFNLNVCRVPPPPSLSDESSAAPSSAQMRGYTLHRYQACKQEIRN